MGVMLFMLVEASFPFSEFDDIWYRRLQKSPQLYMKGRKKEMDPDLLELVAGMIRKEPSQRFTMQDIANSAWFNGETESEEHIFDHFNSLKCAENQQYVDNHGANQAQRALFTGGDAAMRGPNSLSIEAFVEQMDTWKDLKYFELDKSKAEAKTKTKGFKTHSVGAKVIGRLWRYLETLEDEKDRDDLFELQSNPCVHENSLKMTFELKAIKEEKKEEELEDDVSEGEEEEATPFKI